MVVTLREGELRAAHRRLRTASASPGCLVDAAPELLRAGRVRLVLNVDEVVEYGQRFAPLRSERRVGSIHWTIKLIRQFLSAHELEKCVLKLESD